MPENESYLRLCHMIDNTNEPDAVKKFRAAAAAAGPQANPDAIAAMKIYSDFRWDIKKAGMVGQCSYGDIENLLQGSIEKCRRQILHAQAREELIKRFTVMLERVREFIATDEGEVCPKCNLPKFICPCGGPDLPATQGDNPPTAPK